MEYNSRVVPAKNEIEKMFAKPLATLSLLQALAQNPDTDSDTDDLARAANGDVADQLVLLLRQFDRMGFVDIVDEEDSPRFDSEIIDRKPKLIISISGSNDEHGARP